MIDMVHDFLSWDEKQDAISGVDHSYDRVIDTQYAHFDDTFQKTVPCLPLFQLIKLTC